MNERSRPRPPWLVRIVVPLVLASLYFPLLSMVLGSLRNPFATEPGAWTLKWYKEVLADTVLWECLGRSLWVAFLCALGTTGLGVVSALALDRWVFGGRWPLRILSLLSLMMPELILGLSLLSWYALLKLELGLMTVIISHITLTLPFVILVIGARLKGLEVSFEEAGRDLGATETQILRRITLPLLKPAILSGFVLSFLLSFDDFLVTFYTNGAGNDTLPVRLYSLMRTGISPKIQALSSLMFLVSIVLVFSLYRRRELNTLS